MSQIEKISNEFVIGINGLGKKYRLYPTPFFKILDILGILPVLYKKGDKIQDFWALKGLNLYVRKGERVGIIGRNGAGKSTLLKIISKKINPTEGSVQITGNIQALMELGTGFHPDFTGIENIRASLSYQGLSYNQIKEKENEIIDFAEIDEFINQPVRTYSAGMYARLAFSVATSIKPDILIVDEILGAGDGYFTRKCVERMKKITQDYGATILFVSHDLFSVQQMCDRVIWIERGKIVGDGEPLEVIKNYSADLKKDEENRLRAKELKLRKKNISLMGSADDIYEYIVFHFIGFEILKPSFFAKIYSLSLKNDDELICDIDVGGPMDNNPESSGFIIDTPGDMNWGPPEKDNYGLYRRYKNNQGKLAHAPFELRIPKHMIHDSDHFVFEMIYSSNHPFSIEYFFNNQYNFIGQLEIGERITKQFEIKLKSIIEREGITKGYEKVQNDIGYYYSEIDKKTEISINDEKISPVNSEEDNFVTEEKFHVDEIHNSDLEKNTINPLNYRDIHSTVDMQINSIDIISVNNENLRVFDWENPISHISLNITIFNEFKNFIVCLIIYKDDGLTVLKTIQELRFCNPIYGKHTLIFNMKKTPLGPGSYCISAALYEAINIKDNSIEQPCLALWDRCTPFTVQGKIGYSLGHGVILYKETLHIENTPCSVIDLISTT